MVGRQQQILKLHWLKCPKRAREKTEAQRNLEKKVLQFFLISDFLAAKIKVK